MGVVYKAYDTLIKRQVAVKTLHDIRDRAALDLFYKEWGVLASLVHPNIVQVYDVGEFESGGETVPFFVMPLLPGVTLSKLIYDKSHRLTVNRAVDIICQACRGIQAAHDANLVHRDIKPSNILVLEDDSVKIIDFGVAHLVGKEGSTGLKGTPFYMAPEQVRMQRPSALTDIYSLGVVAYEALTRRRPVQGSNDGEIAESILSHIPPAASEINPEVSELLSRVLHKAIAKQPWHRFSTARDFGETLQKVLRNEPIEIFDPNRIQPRIDRAQRAFDGGEFDFAAEIVAELEAEGCLDAQITMLRRQLNEKQRRKRVQALVEGASRCLVEHEYTLALRKVQEALDLDPEDGNVLSLKARIEAASRSRKIDEWLELAERHLANAAFGPARKALESVLEAQPDQPRARQLLAQVNDREKEYARAQEQKAKLHQEAVAAWQKGEISSALAKLDRLLQLDRTAPDTDTGRVAQYQKFYQRVRSEHDTVNNAYSEARALLEQGEFRRALEICDQYLNTYPGHALFRALRIDVEERQSCSLSSYIAEIDQRLAAEPDLDKRVSLLEEACQRYPQETHFERALRQARQRRDLLHSIVARCRQLEESASFNEAIEQWKMLESIDLSYPGVQIEVERLVARRDQQAREDAKAEWVQRVEHELAAGDAERACKTCDRALEEFAGDPELAQLAETARRGVERSSQAMELLTQANQLLARDDFEEGIAKLRAAIELDPGSPALRATLGNALLEQARKLILSDWRAAEGLVQEGSALLPDSALSKSLQTLIHDRKREDAVSWCLAKARQLQSEGKAEEALQLVERVLATYPGVPRLERLRETLRPMEGAPGVDRARGRDLDELRLIRQQAEQHLADAIAQGLAGRAEEIEHRWPEDAEIRATVLEILRKLGTRAHGTAWAAPVRGKPPGRASTATGEPEVIEALEAVGGGGHATHAPAKGLDAGPIGPVAVAPAPVTTARPAARPAPTIRVKRNVYLWLIAAGAVGAVFVLLAVSLLDREPVEQTAGLAEVQLTTQAGAKIVVTGSGKTLECVAPDCKLSLPAGEYAVQASLAGYRPAQQTVSLQPGAALPLAIDLEPLPAVLRLISDLQRGSIYIDGVESEAKLEEGSAELNLEPGAYAIEVRSGPLTASMYVDVATGRAPRFEDAIAARELQAYVVASFAGAGELRSSDAAVALQLDGAEQGAASNGALQLAGFTPGLHELAFTSGGRQIRRNVEVGEGPALTAILVTDRNLGGVIVEAGVAGADVLINDGRYRHKTGNSGRVRFTLPPGDYSASVSKAGHESPAPQAFTIRKGDETRLSFELRVKPQMATLTIAGAPAGAEVWLDDRRSGDVDRDGNYSGSVAAGSHRVELRRLPEMFAPQPTEKQFAEGATVALGGADLPLRAVKGKIQIQLEPAIDAAVTIRQGNGAEQKISPGTFYKEPGDYIVTATAAGYQKSEAGRRVTAGQTAVFRLTLTREVVQQERRRFGFEELAKVGGFEKADGLMVRKGGEFALLPLSPSAGSYTFTANVRGGGLLRGVGIGKARIQWVVDYADPANYVLFELGEDSLTRTVVSGGQNAETVKIPFACAKSTYYSVTLEIAPGGVTHKVLCKGQWVMLDDWKPAGRNLADGKFGFFVPAKTTLAISHFDAVEP
jgi:serine/threonine-protein kinase